MKSKRELRLEAFVITMATCPVCKEPEACDEECSLSTFNPMAYKRILDARLALKDEEF